MAKNVFGVCKPVVLITVIISLCSHATSTKVSVYYESLCPDSIRFIGYQLYPHWKELSNFVDLELVPYGKALHNVRGEKYEFFCQHGPAECRGNKYQACLLNQNRGKDSDVPAIYCIMKSRNPSSFDNVKACAERTGHDVDNLKYCYESGDADELLAKHGNRTWQLIPNISFVPTIVFDDQYNKTETDQALMDFVAVVCDKIKDAKKPKVCDGKELPQIPTWDYGLS